MMYSTFSSWDLSNYLAARHKRVLCVIFSDNRSRKPTSAAAFSGTGFLNMLETNLRYRRTPDQRHHTLNLFAHYL